jgi:hypothetical protein
MPFVVEVRRAFRGKDAGRPDSGVLSGQPRTQHRGVRSAPKAQLVFRQALPYLRAFGGDAVQHEPDDPLGRFGGSPLVTAA